VYVLSVPPLATTEDEAFLFERITRIMTIPLPPAAPLDCDHDPELKKDT
jgi:hypothetical protein